MAKKKGNRGKNFQRKVVPPVVPEIEEKPTTPAVSDDTSYKIEFMSSTVASMTSIPKPVFTKLCRLCESKDGPFLNIFDSQKVLAKKIHRVLPIVIDEYDKLPHKICFRCSAKVEELHEFVERCIRTQESLKKCCGESKAALARKVWEDKLKESKTTNDDYCESLIKKAMEKIGPVPDFEPEKANESKPSPSLESKSKGVRPKKSIAETVKTIKVKTGEELLPEEEPVKMNERSLDRKGTKELKADEEKEKPYPVRSNRTRADMRELSPDDVEIKTKESAPNPPSTRHSLVGMIIKEQSGLVGGKNKKVKTNDLDSDSIDVEILDEDPKHVNNKSNNVQHNNKSNNVQHSDVINVSPEIEKNKNKKEEEKSPQFDIMQHVCTIKVGGAGFLYQCKLCKRNFLKKEVVLTHACAKPKKDIIKPSMSKNDTIEKLNQQHHKELIETLRKKTIESISLQNFSIDTEPPKPNLQVRPKPGPASKKKLYTSESNNKPEPQENSIPPAATTVKVPNVFPGNASRYKLKPGPNNSYILEADSEQAEETVEPSIPVNTKKNKTKAKSSSKYIPPVIDLDLDDRNNTPEPVAKPVEVQSRTVFNKSYPNLTSATEVGKFLGYQSGDGASTSAPYPVGLFQTIPQESATPPPNFATAAMKKQSYSIVQTGNPSKLLISTKQQPPQQEHPVSKTKKGKKSIEPEVKQPFQVVIEDSDRKEANDGFFTFINVDPLLQPSYVLPTPNIIQESQISTSTPGSDKNKKAIADMYTCELCRMEFAREKKLLAHLQSHYKEEEKEEDTRPRKRQRKS